MYTGMSQNKGRIENVVRIELIILHQGQASLHEEKQETTLTLHI